MKEGLVLEIYDRHVVVLTRAGEFLKLKKQGEVSIGDIYREKPQKKLWQYYAAAAVLVMVITSFTGYNAYAHQVVGYVDIKGSKTVRLYVNRLGKVQKIDGLNNSGSIVDLPINDAIKQLDDIAKQEGIYDKKTKVDIDSGKLKKSGFDPEKIKQKANNIINKEKDSNPDKNKDEKKNINKPSEKDDSGNTKKSKENKENESGEKNKNDNSSNIENTQSDSSKQDHKKYENKQKSKKDTSIITNSSDSSSQSNGKNQNKYKK